MARVSTARSAAETGQLGAHRLVGRERLLRVGGQPVTGCGQLHTAPHPTPA